MDDPLPKASKQCLDNTVYNTRAVHFYIHNNTVTLHGERLPPFPLPPTLLASCEIADSQSNHIICHRRHSCQLLTGLPGANFSRGGKREQYTARTQYTHLVGLELCGQIFGQWLAHTKAGQS